MHVKFERVITISLPIMDINANFAFDLETGNVKGQGH